jgi:hypothetical protein
MYQELQTAMELAISMPAVSATRESGHNHFDGKHLAKVLRDASRFRNLPELFPFLYTVKGRR